VKDGRGDDRVFGGPGPDMYVMGRVHGPGVSGTDHFFGGGSSHDSVAWVRSVAFSVDLTLGLAGTPGDFDHLRSVEEATGWFGDDMLSGSPGRNKLDGFGGDDHIEGRDGDDWLIGGDGTDEIDRGNGDDLCESGETVLNCES